MRSLHALVFSGLGLGSVASAETLTIGVGGHASTMPAGGDQGSRLGVSAEVDVPVYDRVSIHAELAYESIQTHSDEIEYVYKGTGEHAVVGLRFDIVPHERPAQARLFFVLAGGAELASLCCNQGAQAAPYHGFMLQAGVGLEVALGSPTTDTMLRVEAQGQLDSLLGQKFPLALVAAAFIAHRF
jgi:hypothetical protein